MTAASDRLVRTRLAIIDHLQHARHGSPPHDTDGDAQGQAVHGRWEEVKSAVRDWWRNHPVHMGLELAQPMIAAYAGHRPLRLLALSAAAGALIVLARPWRLMSVTGLLMAAIRSPQLSSAVLSALRAGPHPAREPSPTARRSS